MNLLLAISFELRLAALFLCGLAAGSLVNLAAWRLAWQPRNLSPWSPTPRGVAARRWADRIPLVGWFALRREAPLHGRGFWIRPLLVELLCGLVFAALYAWEIGAQGLLPLLARQAPVGAMPMANVWLALHSQFVVHLVLVLLMLVASLIDVDERTIPDTVTLPGTLLGLVTAAVLPWSLLPGAVWLAPAGALELDFLRFTSPQSWSVALDRPHVGGLEIAWACWWGWCFALLPRRWRGRRGWLRACGLIYARLSRDKSTRWIGGLGLVGMGAIWAVWKWAPQTSWAGLLTALVGLAGGGGVIWAVRLVGTAALRREAMGFGDVLLMAMIGTVVGWQACLLIFFLAPFLALVAQVVFKWGQEIPYGPFLCLATLVVIVRWGTLWPWAEAIFSLGWLVPGLMGVCLVLLGVLLGLWQLLSRLMGRTGR